MSAVRQGCLEGTLALSQYNSLRPSDAYIRQQPIIDSNYDLSPGRRPTIILTNAEKFIKSPLGANFSEFSIQLHIFSFKKIHLKMSSAKWQPFCLGLNVIKHARWRPKTRLIHRPTSRLIHLIKTRTSATSSHLFISACNTDSRMHYPTSLMWYFLFVISAYCGDICAEE